MYRTPFLAIFFCLFSALVWPQDGALDPTFGNGGIVITDFFNDSDVARAITGQSGDRVVAAGSRDIQGSGTEEILVRYLANGTLDSSFGNNGVVVLPEPTKLVETLLDDSILVVEDGWFSSPDVLTLFTPDGQPDLDFGTGGSVILSISDRDRLMDYFLQPDGKILLALESEFNEIEFLGMVRLMPDGSFDSSFGTSGVVLLELPDDPSNIQIGAQQDGKVLASVVFQAGNNTQSRILTFQYSEEGTLDLNYGNNGIIEKTFEREGLIAIMELDNYGRPTFFTSELSFGPNGTSILSRVWRYDLGGNLDIYFGNDGYHFFGTQQLATEMFIQPNDRILLASVIPDFEYSNLFMKRILYNGLSDSSFGGVGYSDFQIADVTLVESGKIMAFGNTYWFDGPEDWVLIRMRNNPLSIRDFNQGDWSLFPVPTSNRLYLEAPEGSDLKEFEIMDMLGRSVIKGHFTRDQSIDVSSLNPGLYALRINEKTLKFIKQ